MLEKTGVHHLLMLVKHLEALLIGMARSIIVLIW